jgi:hypothetical protein
MGAFSLLAIAVPLLTPSLPAAQGKVWIVGPGAYNQIQPAIDAALDGDTLLIKYGNYASFVIDDKALHLVAEAGVSPTVQSPVRIENLSAGKVVCVAGLQLSDTNSSHTYGLLVRNNLGAVRLVDCRVEGSTWYPTGTEAVRLNQSGDVAFVRCSLYGGMGLQAPYGGAQGLFSRISNVAFYDGGAFGGDGGGAPFGAWGQSGGRGGTGCESPDGLLFAGNAQFSGGVGGNGGNENCDIFNPIGPGPGGNGGHGLFLGSSPPSSFSPQANLLGCLLQGGSGGGGGGGFCYFPWAPNGSPGSPLLINNGAASTLTDPIRLLKSPRVARELTQVPLSVTGITGDSVRLLVSLKTGWDYQAALGGVALVPTAFMRTGFVGIIPGSGTLNFNLPLGDLGPGVESRTLHLQAVVTDASGNPKLTSFGSLAVLDQQF